MISFGKILILILILFLLFGDLSTLKVKFTKNLTIIQNYFNEQKQIKKGE